MPGVGYVNNVGVGGHWNRQEAGRAYGADGGGVMDWFLKHRRQLVAKSLVHSNAQMRRNSTVMEIIKSRVR